jgi:hypothetical protein
MKILKLTFALFLLATISFAQPNEPKKRMPKRTDNFIRMRGIRAGFDLTRPFQDWWTDGSRYGSELSFDLELWPNWFPALETGYEVMKLKTENIDYASSGNFTRIGFDYNFLEAETVKDKDLFYAGLRYGFSLAHQKTYKYQIDNYWGPETGSYPRQDYTAHWIEMVVGLKGEVLKNVYLGWSVRGKIKLSEKNLDMPPVYFIPGYGKAEKGFTLDFSYSIYYNLPWDFRRSQEKPNK